MKQPLHPVTKHIIKKKLECIYNAQLTLIDELPREDSTHLDFPCVKEGLNDLLQAFDDDSISDAELVRLGYHELTAGQ